MASLVTNSWAVTGTRLIDHAAEVVLETGFCGENIIEKVPAVLVAYKGENFAVRDCRQPIRREAQIHNPRGDCRRLHRSSHLSLLATSSALSRMVFNMPSWSGDCRASLRYSALTTIGERSQGWVSRPRMSRTKAASSSVILSPMRQGWKLKWFHVANVFALFFKNAAKHQRHGSFTRKTRQQR